jgi:hypothetical protein
MKAALFAVLLVLPTIVLAQEKEEFTLTLNSEGLWCGKHYMNNWSSTKRYQCKTRKEWEKKGVTFPASRKVILGPPILSDTQ